MQAVRGGLDSAIVFAYADMIYDNLVMSYGND